jgi:general secretion pathway protein B
MSVILDVLRKLDREKSSRRSAAANIALEILKPEPPRSEKRNRLYVTAIGLAAIAAAAITYALMGFGPLSKSPSPERINPPTRSQEIAQAPFYSGSISKSSLPPAKISPALSQKVAPTPPPPVESGLDNRGDINRVSPEVRTPADNKIPGFSPVEKEAGPTPPQKAPDKSVIAPPSLKISAIIWYEDPSKRFAMINDAITYEGSVIEEVKVEEIYPNRVRFSHNGRHFEISVK